MRKLFYQVNGIRYYFLLIEGALIVDYPDQQERKYVFVFNDRECNNNPIEHISHKDILKI